MKLVNTCAPWMIVVSLGLYACGDDGTPIDTLTTGAGSSSSGGTTTANPTTEPATTDGPTTDVPTTDVPTTDAPTTDATTTTAATTTDATSSTTASTTDPGTSTSTTDASSSSTTDASSSTGMVDLCANEVLDQDETDVDCGGAVCGPCGDGLLCVANEDCASLACAGGVCVVPECAQDTDCAALDDACNKGTCDLNAFKCVATPVMDGVVCDDTDLCTDNDVCTAGVCAGAAKDCKANDTACGTGACNADTGVCETKADAMKDGLACDDLNGCTLDTKCAAGVCGDPNNKGYLFYEPFINNNAAWTLGTNWEIKPAAVSPAGGGGTGTDPATDHTSTMDNGVAGELVGGLLNDANVPANQQLCLTSPKVDSAGLPTAWISFWRHLHADYPNYAIQRIEVFNGNTWVLLETGYGPPVTNDADWKQIKFDVTAHKNANMQFRICHSRTSAGSYSHGGWSVDDVTIAATACTP